jgi:hypothetical protein
MAGVFREPRELKLKSEKSAVDSRCYFKNWTPKVVTEHETPKV